MSKPLFLLVVCINLLCAPSYALAQTNTEFEKILIEANKEFDNEQYVAALKKYQKVLEHRSSDSYVLSQIEKAKEEILYIRIEEGGKVEYYSEKYIESYGADGKYIFEVEKGLGEYFRERAYVLYNNKEIESLENVYNKYLNLLGREKSEDMKKWLYILCNEAGMNYLKSKDWNDAKLFFEKCLKYTSTEQESMKSRKGVEMASKKKRKWK